MTERSTSRTKRSSRRPVAVTPHVAAALTAHRTAMRERALAAGATLPDDALVFSDDPLGERPWRPDSTSRKFRRLRTTAGLTETRLHDLRHYMATQLLGSGVDPKVVAQRGGWTRVATMLDRYAHVLPVNDQAAAGLIGGVTRRG